MLRSQYGFPLCFWLATALGQVITITPPTNVKQCGNTTFNWSGGTPPYNILFNTTASVITADQTSPNVTIIEGLAFGNIPKTSFVAVMYFPVGSNVQFQVTDSLNMTSPPVNFHLGPGANSLCEVYFQNGVEPLEELPGPIIVNPITDPQSCDQGTYLQWFGGISPYIMTIETVGLPILQQQIFGGFNSTSPTIQIQFAPGTSFDLQVEDATGAVGLAFEDVLGGVFGSQCVISNLTTPDPSVTETLPFPTFYSLQPTPTQHFSGDGGGPSTSQGLSFGGILGIAIGVPVGVLLLKLLIVSCVMVERKEKRRKRLEPLFQSLNRDQYGMGAGEKKGVLGERQRASNAQTVYAPVTSDQLEYDAPTVATGSSPSQRITRSSAVLSPQSASHSGLGTSAEYDPYVQDGR